MPVDEGGGKRLPGEPVGVAAIVADQRVESAAAKHLIARNSPDSIAFEDALARTRFSVTSPPAA